MAESKMSTREGLRQAMDMMLPRETNPTVQHAFAITFLCGLIDGGNDEILRLRARIEELEKKTSFGPQLAGGK